MEAYIGTLVLLARDGITEAPRNPVTGAALTVDHINGRDHEFPHRLENLR